MPRRVDPSPPVPSPLALPAYRALLLMRFSAVAAGSGIVVVLGYQLYDLARADYGMSIRQAAFQLGILGFVQFLPQFLFAPFAGVVADRHDRRTVVGLSLLVILTVAVALALATYCNWRSLPLLFALGGLMGTARVFMGPAMSSIAPMLVPPEALPRSVALNSFAFLCGSAGGPTVAGLLFAVAPFAPYLLSSVLLAVAVICVLGLPPLPALAANRDAHPLRQIADGFVYVWRDRFLLGCITLDLFAVLLGGATALLPVYARDILTVNGHPVGAYGVGVMRAMPGLGAALVAAWLARHPIERRVGEKMLWAVAAYGAATIGFGVSRNLLLSLALLAALGAFDMVSVFIRTALVQMHVPDHVRGRVSSLSGLAISASNELGELESGLAAATIGAEPAVVLGGIGAIVITGLWAVLFPGLRRARTFATPHRQPDISEPDPIEEIVA